jgi:hypothetical protein
VNRPAKYRPSEWQQVGYPALPHGSVRWSSPKTIHLTRKSPFRTSGALVLITGTRDLSLPIRRECRTPVNFPIADDPPGFDKIFDCEGQSLDQISIDDRHRWIVLIPASTLYLIHRNLVTQTNFKQPRPVLAGHKQTSAGGVVSDAVGHSFSVCAEAFDVFGRRDHARS